MKITQYLPLIAFGITSFNANADLPTKSDYQQLNQAICGLPVPKKAGRFKTKSIFTLVGQETTFKLKAARKKSYPFCIKCKVKSAHMYFKTSVYDFPFHHTAAFNFFSDRGNNFTDFVGRTTSTIFDKSGISVVTAWSQFFPKGPDFDTCDTTFVFIQNKPTVGKIYFKNTTGTITAGSYTFKASTGSMDQYSLFSQQQKPLLYKWSAINIYTGSSSNVTTASSSTVLNLPSGGEYIISVKTYDGKYFSPTKTKSIFVEGPICNTIEGCFIEPF